MRSGLILFSGCSFTAGHGWNPDDPGAAARDHPDLWCNLVAGGQDRINVGSGGASNRDIFRNTVQAVSEHWDQISVALVQWTSMPRYRFDLGLEEWNTGESLQNRDRSDEINIAEAWTDRQTVNDVIDRFLALHHLHPEICDVIAMTACLRQLCDRAGIRLVLINGLCPWDHGYFSHRTRPDRKPSDLTRFTQDTILHVRAREDSQIFRLYDRIHDNYSRLGTIHENHWANLYNSFKHLQVDTNHDRQHPGKLSNQIYAKIIKDFLAS